MGLNITLNTYSRLAPVYNRRSQLHHWSEYIFKMCWCILYLINTFVNNFVNFCWLHQSFPCFSHQKLRNQIFVSPKDLVTESSSHQKFWSPNVHVTKCCVTKSSCHHMYVWPNVRVTICTCHQILVTKCTVTKWLSPYVLEPFPHDFSGFCWISKFRGKLVKTPPVNCEN